ncbi:alpha-ketoglutarate-dependent dioxygenase AlkB [Psychromonas sp. SR45-3]|uniref:alpha-ketoglutarate-dependent dioxygenase AlkB family protein n=1 Tax=Psychromonas sp. SR45-3 TaxID=2760930 RepID=UPI0015FB5533|nr:alpha-ketoglutarate-dependent dioxygenase AlkB [Psychromonas sp. SR45-3]MBB1274728.1 alpha-ketoglutarate-dependent dioxygenase AlkB [Psychromonas sp. SR45-3]
MTLSLFEDEPPIDLINSDGVVTCWQQLLTEDEASALFDELLNAAIWRQESITVYEQRHLQPRLTAWYGDYGVSADGGYQKLYQTVEFTARLLSLKSQIEAVTSYRFNCVLANLYRDGQDSVGYHADNEKILGENPVIASYSLGATRRFLLKHNQDKLQKVACELQHNSLLLMHGELQHHWQHCITKTQRNVAPRINLTFRLIKPL